MNDDAFDRPGFRVTGKQWATVLRLSAELSRKSSHHFPWNGLEDQLTATGRPLVLIGYGSLLDSASASRTITSPGSRRPAVAFGVQRVFNYVMPESILQRYPRPDDPRAIAALNVYRTRDPTEAINGVGIAVPPADIPALREREQGYDLCPVATLWWDDPSGAPFVAHILCAPDHSGGGPKYTDDNLLPHREYYQLCRNGAASVSTDFLTFYLDTALLADRRQTARTWESAGSK